VMETRNGSSCGELWGLWGHPCPWRAYETMAWLTAAFMEMLWYHVALASYKLTHG